MGQNSSPRLAAVAFLALIACPIAAVRASTVVTMNAERLSEYAGQVVIADIESSESYWAASPKRIETRLSLANIEYWKGSYDDAPRSFDLIVPGGRVGQTQMRICCAPQFKAGQRWILFLLPQYKTFPTVGLGQGSFLISADKDGATHVYQEGFAGITGIDKNGDFEYALYEQRPAHPHAELGNLSIQTEQRSANDNLLTLDAFKTALQPILDRSHDYEMTKPAGARLTVVYRPTSLKKTNGRATGTVRGANQSPVAAHQHEKDVRQETKRTDRTSTDDDALTDKTTKQEAEPENKATKPNRRDDGGEK